MTCFICGDTKNLKTLEGIYKTICAECKKTTPKKVNKQTFDTFYWGKNADQVPKAVKQEFYEDYLASTNTLQTYKDATTTILE